MADLKFFSHYPFSDEAKDWVRSQGIVIDEDAISGGEARLRAGLSEGGEIKPGLELEESQRSRVLHYAASRMILAAWKNRYAIKRMAVSESKAARRYLDSIADKDSGYVERIAAMLKLDFAKQEGAGSKTEFSIPFYQYLLYTPRDIHYKLVNMPMKGGRVHVTAEQKTRIMEEAIRKRIENAVLPTLKEPGEQIKDAIKRLEALIPRETIMPSSIDAKDFPPCIRKMVDDLSASINVPHSGRLALAIYLIKAGLSDEQICKVFSGAPDYSAQTTSYQVAYIRNKAYSMQSCQTMDTYGLCIAECRCFNPAKYRDSLHGRYARASMQDGADSHKGEEEHKGAKMESHEPDGARQDSHKGEGAASARDLD